MKKRLNCFWSKNLQSNIKANEQKIYYYLSSELLTSYDKSVVKAYLNSIVENMPIFKKTKSVIVIPDILLLFSLDSTFDYNKTITRFQLNQEIIKLTKIAKQERVSIYQEVDISKLNSYQNAIDEIFSQKNLEEKNLTENQAFLTHPVQFKRRPRLYDFLDTETFNLSSYSEKGDTFQSELESLVDYFETEYGTEGIIFNSVSKFVKVEEKDQEDEKIRSFKYILGKISKEKNFVFLSIFNYLRNNKIINKMLEKDIFETVIIKFEDYFFAKPNKLFSVIEKWNNSNALLWINPNLFNINFENVAKTSFYHFDLFYTVLNCLLLFKKSLFITWPFFQEAIDSFESNSFKILENKYGYEQKFFLNNIKTEELIIGILKNSLDLFLDADFSFYNISSLKKVNFGIFTRVRKYILYTKDKKFKLIFNLSNKRYPLKFFNFYTLVFSSANYQKRFIRPYQFIILKKN